MKTLLDTIETILGKPIQGLVFLSKSKDSLVVKYASFTSIQLKELSTMAEAYNPDWSIQQQSRPSFGFDDPVTFIGPRKGLTKDDILSAFGE